MFIHAAGLGAHLYGEVINLDENWRWWQQILGKKSRVQF